MGKPTHPKVIVRQRHRYQKLWKLRMKYAQVTSEVERERLFEKASKVSPGLSREQFVTPLCARGMI